MGMKLTQHEFQRADYNEFKKALEDETHLLEKWVYMHDLSDNHIRESGFELECWILDHVLLPVDVNQTLIESLNDPHIVSEIAQSNIELNLNHYELHGNALMKHYDHLKDMLAKCYVIADQQKWKMIFIGALPTASLAYFSSSHLTNEHRYYAIELLMEKIRHHVPINIHINAPYDNLNVVAQSMAIGGIIAAFQMHYRVDSNDSAISYNAAQIIAAVMVAIASNSPFLLGHELWMESRIPFLEQLFSFVQTDKNQTASRALFGNSYLKKSMLELFLENDHAISILLPVLMQADTSEMSHLKLHNGTIYRWNRPVLGMVDGQPHFRIESRILPSGPTIVDMCANAAFFFGLMQYFTANKLDSINTIEFHAVKNNFYHAARDGLRADFIWSDNKIINARELVLKHLIPCAREGLNQLDIDHADTNSFLSIIEERVSKQKTGSDWQIEFYHRYGDDLFALTECYQQLQEKGMPVHEWPI